MPCHPTTSEDDPLVTAFPHLCCNPLRPRAVGRVRFPFFPNIRSRIDVCLLALVAGGLCSLDRARPLARRTENPILNCPFARSLVGEIRRTGITSRDMPGER